ncbi:MAG TPA: hypothetical protein PKA00_22020 [Saprospiraceae bacterium]|nr:hypothetical protein [Saprospiraceae bacterium]HMQ85605.1 hypothetical protein [Saprospiraceae bacterium]
MDFTVSRTFSSLYISLDIVWLLVFILVLLYFKRRQAVIVGLLAGVLYFLVDYGIFYKLLGTREITGADPFLFLSWLSMSYGFTNFAWIWLLLDRDKYSVEWSLLPILGWITIGQLSTNFGADFTEISISRGTGAYHGVMALILCFGYLYVVIHNLKGKEKVNILWLIAIGVGVQFAWEVSLLISGIRPPLWQPLIVNSLIETNLGLPIIYFIHKYVTKRWKEDLRPW